MERFVLQVNKPCSESWENMQPKEQGRFCALCQKTVVDFATMSEAEIVQFFQNYQGGGLCGRILPQQQGQVYPVGKPLKISYKRQIWKVAAVGIGLLVSLAQPLAAQHLEFQAVAVSAQNPQPERELWLHLQLTIENGKESWVCAYTAVDIYSPKGEWLAGAEADENGKISILLSEEQWGKGVYVRSHYINKKQGEFIPKKYQNKTKQIKINYSKMGIPAPPPLPPPPPPSPSLIPPLMGIMD